MSSLGKIFLGLALAGAIAALVIGWFVVQNLATARTNLTQTQQERDLANRTAEKAKKDADTAKQEADAAATELTETKKNLDDLNGQLKTAQKQQDDLKTAVQTANDAADKAKKDLQAINEALGMSPEQVKESLKKAQDAETTAENEKKIAIDELQAATKQVADLKDAINRSGPGTMPPGISGKVTFVNRTWNFVVLNVGLSDGVVPNGELIIYRGKDFLGKIRVTSAEANSAVADILPDAKADIQVGDNVLN